MKRNRRTHVAFDTEAPLGSLIRFHDDKTELVDISEVSAQMRIFDALASDRSGSIFVVDLRAGGLCAMLDMLTDLRILRDAQEGAFDVVFHHIIGGSIESIREVSETLDRFSCDKHIIVTNPGNGADLSDSAASDVRANIERDGGVEINIPALNKQAYLEIDRTGASFAQFVNNKHKNGSDASYSYVLRARAQLAVQGDDRNRSHRPLASGAKLRLWALASSSRIRTGRTKSASSCCVAPSCSARSDTAR